MNGTTDRRLSTSSNRSEVLQFPDFHDPSGTGRAGSYTIYEEEEKNNNNNNNNGSNGSQVQSSQWRHTNGAALHSDRWQPRREHQSVWSNGAATAPRRHTRQKSLSDAIKTIRGRKASVSANAQEIAEALKAPVSYKLILLCITWYMSSALTNTSSKAILNAWNKPVTLTLIQFAFVWIWCLFFAWLASISPTIGEAIPVLRIGIRKPSREIVRTTLPLALFQLFGHLLSSAATAKIPVSLVHTIKGLSPLFTVLAYRFYFGVPHSTGTYFSLVPLTVGVVLACSVEFSGNFWGVTSAFVAALVFVTQNIYSKSLFNDAARAEADAQVTRAVPKKLDKLNLLCYCSGMAFVLNFPLWLYGEGFGIISDVFADGAVTLSHKGNTMDHGPLALEFCFNGIFHFGQNIMAFVLLSAISPVTYSVASLIKRVFVIVAAIIWFGQSTTKLQAAGIGLTFVGLYLYDRTSDADKAERKARLQELSKVTSLLPTAEGQDRASLTSPMRAPILTESPMHMFSGQNFASNGHVNGGSKREDASGPGGPGQGINQQQWLPPGTKQEETWRHGDQKMAIAT